MAKTQRSSVDLYSGENIDINDLLVKRARREIVKHNQNYWDPNQYTYNNEKPNSDLKSFFFDPISLEANAYGTVRTISPFNNRKLSCRILRYVAEKAWIINLCITTSISQARPFFKESTEENQRGFRIRHKKAKKAGRDMNESEKKEAARLVEFFLNTGDIEDSNRVDDLDKYATKIIRDLYQLDQISVELQRTKGGELCAFWAMDTATIELTLPSVEMMTGIKYVQIINNLMYAHYTKDDLIFDCRNPRTDIEKAGYGYSVVEQAVDLITSAINTFGYNAGFFTENKLPRGMLLLNGPANEEEIQDVEEYLTNALSGPPGSQWKIPIVPTGKTKDAASGGRLFEWINFQATNKDMEWQNWFDLQMSAIAAMFEKSLEEFGLHSQKSQPIISNNLEAKQEASKSLGLGDLLAFLEKHFNQILAQKNPEYVFEFVGYEKDDMRMIADIDRTEVDTWKTLNEKRVEKGFDPIDLKNIQNPADLPMNVQAVQIYQSQNAMGGMGGGFGDMEDEGFGDEEGGDTGWEDLEGDTEGKGKAPDEAAAEEGGSEEGGGGDWDEIEKSVGKSLGGAGHTRIVI